MTTKRLNRYRIHLAYGSYYALSAPNVRKAIRSAIQTARKAFHVRRKASLKVVRIQRFYGEQTGFREADLKVPRT